MHAHLHLLQYANFLDQLLGETVRDFDLFDSDHIASGYMLSLLLQVSACLYRLKCGSHTKKTCP